MRLQLFGKVMEDALIKLKVSVNVSYADWQDTRPICPAAPVDTYQNAGVYL